MFILLFSRRKIRMKYFVVVATVILAVNALTDSEQWAAFKETHGKTYKSALEESLRYATFQSNLRKIEEHNNKYDNGEVSYYLGVTKFADMSSEEFRAMLERQMMDKPAISGEKHVYNPEDKLPESVDWRTVGAVLGVEDQGQCGSCWAFSAAESLEGQNFIKHNISIQLSTQQLLDCSTSYGNGNCDQGGLMTYAFKYVHDHGLVSASDYPYKGVQGRKCNIKGAKSQVELKSYVEIPAGDEKALTHAIAMEGPTSLAMDATPLQLYFGGILNDPLCSHQLNHGVLGVGYGTKTILFVKEDYYIIKNSWGKSWGESGYFRLIRNSGSQCGVADSASYPIIA